MVAAVSSSLDGMPFAMGESEVVSSLCLFPTDSEHLVSVHRIELTHLAHSSPLSSSAQSDSFRV